MLIVLEGLDGAGKSTQVELVRRMFAQEGVESHFLHFPRFDAPVYGELIARFLRGELGAVDKVDPYLVALLFAGDRADAAAQLRCWLDAGHAVVLDRYVYSNVGLFSADCTVGANSYLRPFTTSSPSVCMGKEIRGGSSSCTSTRTVSTVVPFGVVTSRSM